MPDISIRLHCGTHTCAKVAGEFCQFVGSRKMGTIPLCCLFPSPEAAHTDLQERDGWLQRCAACIDAEMNDPTIGLRQRIHDLEVSLTGISIERV
jgi:hypothetical protein